jgi:hypothetical protein
MVGEPARDEVNWAGRAGPESCVRILNGKGASTGTCRASQSGTLATGWFDFGGKLLELLANEPRPQYDRRRVSFAFEVDAIRSARAELIDRGVEPVTEIEGGPESLQYWAYFKDAKGNLFKLLQRVTD